jgi:hypothetical protein
MELNGEIDRRTKAKTKSKSGYGDRGDSAALHQPARGGGTRCSIVTAVAVSAAVTASGRPDTLPGGAVRSDGRSSGGFDRIRLTLLPREREPLLEDTLVVLKHSDPASQMT